MQYILYSLADDYRSVQVQRAVNANNVVVFRFLISSGCLIITLDFINPKNLGNFIISQGIFEMQLLLTELKMYYIV